MRMSRNLHEQVLQKSSQLIQASDYLQVYTGVYALIEGTFAHVFAHSYASCTSAIPNIFEFCFQ